jgi:hypothetical protein
MARRLPGELAIDPHKSIDEPVLFTVRGEHGLGMNSTVCHPYNIRDAEHHENSYHRPSHRHRDHLRSRAPQYAGSPSGIQPLPPISISNPYAHARLKAPTTAIPISQSQPILDANKVIENIIDSMKNQSNSGRK